MKRIILITAVILIQTLSFGQNLFFIGEKAYPSTETFSLKSNSDFQGKDLDVLIAKDNFVLLDKLISNISSVVHSFI